MMKIPLQQFEQYISETILKRGLAYYENDQVMNVQEISPNKYEATVEGTENYTVNITLKGDNVVDQECDCPYDDGPICKHAVALIFYLQAQELELEQKPKTAKKVTEKKPAKPKKATKPKTIQGQVEELLEKISHDELKQFIFNKAKENKEFRSMLLAAFAHENANESKEYYIKQINGLIRAATGRGGYMEWSAARRLGKSLDELINNAQLHNQRKNYRSAIFISFALIESLAEALERIDDSNGLLGSIAANALEVIDNLPLEELSKENRILVLNNCLIGATNSHLTGWGWHLDLLQIAGDFASTKEEIEQLKNLLTKPSKYGYDTDEKILIGLQIVEKTQGKAEKEAFINKNISFPSIRKFAIKEALDAEDYTRAKKLAAQGKLQDAAKSPGLAKEWEEILLRIALKEQDTEEIIRITRKGLMDTLGFHAEYYGILKDTIKQGKWDDFVDDLIKETETKTEFFKIYFLPHVYISEKRWPALMQFLEQFAALKFLEQYEKYLPEEYASKIINMYLAEAIHLIKNRAGKNYYIDACNYLNRMLELGGKDKVSEAVLYIRKNYSNRPSLINELDKLNILMDPLYRHK